MRHSIHHRIRLPHARHRSVVIAAWFVLAAIAAGCAHSGRSSSGPTISGQSSAGASSATTPASSLDADQALYRLMDGNARFVANKSIHLDLSAKRRAEIRQGQKPFAVILGCSDSRVPPNYIFDTGLGDLFVIRVAGNVADDVGIGSIEYAVEHLGAHLVVVLGHEKCGAVDATLNCIKSHTEAPGHIQSIVHAIEPAVKSMPNGPGDDLDDAVRANVQYVSHLLRHSKPILEHEVESGKVKVVGAYYDLESGRVELLNTAH